MIWRDSSNSRNGRKWENRLAYWNQHNWGSHVKERWRYCFNICRQLIKSSFAAVFYSKGIPKHLWIGEVSLDGFSVHFNRLRIARGPLRLARWGEASYLAKYGIKLCSYVRDACENGQDWMAWSVKFSLGLWFAKTSFAWETNLDEHVADLEIGECFWGRYGVRMGAAVAGIACFVRGGRE